MRFVCVLICCLFLVPCQADTTTQDGPTVSPLPAWVDPFDVPPRPPEFMTDEEWHDWLVSGWHDYHQSFYDPECDCYVYDPLDTWEWWIWEQPQDQYDLWYPEQ